MSGEKEWAREEQMSNFYGKKLLDKTCNGMKRKTLEVHKDKKKRFLVSVVQDPNASRREGKSKVE